jgi:hypothetical protein
MLLPLTCFGISYGADKFIKFPAFCFAVVLYHVDLFFALATLAFVA